MATLSPEGKSELERLQWVEREAITLIAKWKIPTRPGERTGLDRGYAAAAEELEEILEASAGKPVPSPPDRTVLVLAIGHEIGSDEAAARIQRAVSLAINHPDWIDTMGGEGGN